MEISQKNKFSRFWHQITLFYTIISSQKAPGAMVLSLKSTIHTGLYLIEMV